MAIEGSLDVFRLPEILQVIAGQRKTGILTVQGETDIVAVSFKDGQVVAADALNQTVEEGLGQILASQGLVNPRDFSAVTVEHEAGGKRLLDLLLEKGLVHRAQLLDALRLQTYRLLLQLLRWDQGDFKFYAGDEVAYEEGFYAISVEELLIRSLDDLGDDAQAAPPTLDTVYERVPGAAIRFVETGDSPPEGSGIYLAPEDRPLLERIDGHTTARGIAASSGVGEYRVLFTLYKLLRGGAVRAVAGAPVARPGPAAAARATAPAPAAPQPAGAPAAPVGPRPVAVPSPPGRGGGPAAAVTATVRGPGPVAIVEPRGGDDLLPETEAPAPPAPRPRKVVLVKSATPVQATGLAVFAPVLAAFSLAALLLAVPWLAPRHLLLPFPWQDGAREALARNQRAAQYLLVDRAARTYFLLEGRYPDALQDLVTLQLLPSASQRDPDGRPLAYTTDEVSYRLEPVEGGEPVAELAAREAITGDFLLDPDFLALPERNERAPLVLLD
jgi:hypothetical protein